MLDVLAFDVKFRRIPRALDLGILRAHDPRYVCRNINSIRRNISLAYGGRYVRAYHGVGVGCEGVHSSWWPTGSSHEGHAETDGPFFHSWLSWLPGGGFLACFLGSNDKSAAGMGQTDFHSWLSWSPRGDFLAIMQG